MSSPCRKVNRRPMFSGLPLRFHKSIGEDTERGNNLRIPRSFVKKYEKKYGEEISNIILLKPPCGTEWEIEATRQYDVLWFDNGWEAFSKFYSIKSRYSLVFQYEGDSRFIVNIFDGSNLEIDYPIRTPTEADYQFPQASPLLSQKNNIASSNDNGNPSFIKEEEMEIVGRLHTSTTRGNGENSSSAQRSQSARTEVVERLPPLTTGGNKAVQKAKEFKNIEHPSCFSFLICPFNIENHMLWLPNDFAMHLRHVVKNTGNLSLHVSEGSAGKTWIVEMKYEKDRAKFQSGWSEFMQGNKLNHGDVCVLMLTDKNELLFEVNFFRARHAVRCSLSPGPEDNDDACQQHDHGQDESDGDDNGGDSDEDYDKYSIASYRRKKYSLSSRTAQRSPKPTTEVSMRVHSSATGGKARALQADENFNSSDPSCFLVTMQRSSIKQIWLSIEYSKKIMEYIGKNPVTVNLCVPEDSEGGPWNIDMKYIPERAKFRIQGGWRRFGVRHKLNFGDVCGFMLIDKTRLLFEVKIFRRTELVTSSPGIDDDDVDAKDDNDANDGDAADVNTDRSFSRVLQKSSVTHSLSLCSRFTRRYLSNKPSTAELHVPGVKDRHWSVGLRYDNISGKRARFQPRWSKFVQENDFKLGNELVFELTDEKKISFKVVKVAENSTLPPDNDAANENINDDENSKDEDDDEDDDVNSNYTYNDEDEDEYTSAQQHHKRKKSSSSTKSSIKDVGTSDSTGQFLKRRAGVQKDIHPKRAMGNDIALQRAMDFKYVEPHFVVQMSPIDVHGPILLPSTFVMKYLDKRPSHVSLWSIDKDIKYWPVELQHFSNGASFQVGWIEFVQFHGLKDGDACGFELTDKRKFLFDVHIFRAA